MSISNNSTVQICNESKSLTCNFSLIKNQLNTINETFYLLLSLTKSNNNKSDYLWHKINLKLNANNLTNISLPIPGGNYALVRTHSKFI